MVAQITAEDGRIQAERNETFCLEAINRFGWLRATDIAALGGMCKRSVQRTLRRLVQCGQVKRDSNRAGEIYLLRQKGAERLSELFGGTTVLPSLDASRSISDMSFAHRVMCNSLAIWWSPGDHARFKTEREILTNRSPIHVKNAPLGKIPDVLLLCDDDWLWVEVERSKKKQKDYRRLVRIVEAILTTSGAFHIGRGQYAERIAIAADESCIEDHLDRLMEELAERGYVTADQARNSVQVLERTGEYEWQMDLLEDWYELESWFDDDEEEEQENG